MEERIQGGAMADSGRASGSACDDDNEDDDDDNKGEGEANAAMDSREI